MPHFPFLQRSGIRRPSGRIAISYNTYNLQESDINSFWRAAKDKVQEHVDSGRALQKSIYDGKNFAQYMQGNKAPSNEDSKKDAAIKGMELAEFYYLDFGAKLELKGIEKVDDSNAYVVEVILPSGAKTLEYFDINSNLKLRSTQYINSPQGEMALSTDYKDYKEVDGILFPFTRVLPLGGGMKMDAKIESISINTGVEDSIFVIE